MTFRRWCCRASSGCSSPPSSSSTFSYILDSYQDTFIARLWQKDNQRQKPRFQEVMLTAPNLEMATSRICQVLLQQMTRRRYGAKFCFLGTGSLGWKRSGWPIFSPDLTGATKFSSCIPVLEHSRTEEMQ